MFAGRADFSKTVQTLEAVLIHVFATLAKFIDLFKQVTLMVFDCAECRPEVSDLLVKLLGILIDIRKAHAVRNRDLNRFAAFDTGNDKPGATIVDNQPVATVRTVKNNITFANCSALIINISGEFSWDSCTFDIAVSVHVLPPELQLPPTSQTPAAHAFRKKSGLRNEAGADAFRADRTTKRSPALFDANRLEIGHKATLGDAGRVETDTALGLFETMTNDGFADHRLLSANFTNLRHDMNPRKNYKC